VNGQKKNPISIPNLRSHPTVSTPTTVAEVDRFVRASEAALTAVRERC
jgi:hypothetical protein